MAHLHIPDGVLPLALWGPAVALALALVALSAWVARGVSPQRIAYQGALGALVLVAMAVQIPLGPIEYHLTLIGPVGVLLGPAAAFQVVFVACAMLAFVGHGGFTVIGLNALILGAGAAVSRPLYRTLAREREGALPAGPAPVDPRRPAFAMAASTVAAQTVSAGLWLAVVVFAVHVTRARAGLATAAPRLELLAGVAVPVALLGVAVEGAVAYGIARFLARVRPDLLPEAPRPKERR